LAARRGAMTDVLDERDADMMGDSEEDELGALISFANLENVVKHIIRKFKSIEAHDENTEAEIRGVRTELEGRATAASLTELQGELATRVEHFNRTLAGQSDSIASLEVQLERSRVMANSLEKKLEACVKEKAVQDRLVREVQDALQDKVAVAELNMFEAKFAGYATKLEHQEIVSQLADYARADVAERLEESLKIVSKQFDHYSRTAKIDRQLQELGDWVADELQHYAKAKQTTTRLEEIHSLLMEKSLSTERSQAALDDKLRGLSDRVTSIYAELKSDLQLKAMADDLRSLEDRLKKYALKADTDAFQQDCVPKLRYCVESIKAFDDRLRAQDDAIQRMDEVILDKAAKFDLSVVHNRLEQCLDREQGLAEIGKLNSRADELRFDLQQYIAAEPARQENNKPPDYTPVFEDINARITLKADKADLVELYQLKANRLDADELAKLQAVIHRQLEYLAVTAFGLSKLVLTEAKAGESKTIRTQQKAQVLMQSEALWKWIWHNEPPPNLDTLRPPPGRTGRGAGNVDKGGALMEVVDEDKRLVDDAKRTQLEKKLGIVAA